MGNFHLVDKLVPGRREHERCLLPSPRSVCCGEQAQTPVPAGATRTALAALRQLPEHGRDAPENSVNLYVRESVCVRVRVRVNACHTWYSRIS